MEAETVLDPMFLGLTYKIALKNAFLEIVLSNPAPSTSAVGNSKLAGNVVCGAKDRNREFCFK